MVKLIYKNKIILPDLKYVRNIFGLVGGLMFASKEKVKKGMCLVMLGKSDKKFGVGIHMFFCFYPYDVLFINSDFRVVDKKILTPWSSSYTPKKPVKYIIESWKGTFKDINIGDKIQIKHP